MEPAAWINDFLAWAWERHNNVLNQYIKVALRPAAGPALGTCRIIDKAVAGPAAPWHDGRERGKSMNRLQNPTSGRQVRGARP